MAPSRHEILSLYRALLRTSSQYVNYNFRSHARRKITTTFRNNKSLSADAAEQQFNMGKEQLEMLKRQVTISKLYPERNLSVMEIKSKSSA